jgi:hypothetical protein
MKYFIAEFEGFFILRTSKTMVYVAATEYEKDVTFHTKHELAGRANHWGDKALAVVPVREITATEYSELKNSKTKVGA